METASKRSKAARRMQAADAVVTPPNPPALQSRGATSEAAAAAMAVSATFTAMTVPRAVGTSSETSGNVETMANSEVAASRVMPAKAPPRLPTSPRSKKISTGVGC